MIYYGGNDYRDYLAHHGVMGQKWGIRRYQPYSVKPRGSGKTGKEIGEARTYGGSSPKTVNDFNTKFSDFEKQRDVNKLKYLDAKYKLSKIKRKADVRKYLKDKEGDHRYNSLIKKVEKQEKVVSSYENKINNANASIKNLVADAKSKGFKVHTNMKTRDVAAGRKAIATALGAIGGGYIAYKAPALSGKAVSFATKTAKLGEYTLIVPALTKSNFTTAGRVVKGAIAGGALARAAYKYAYKKVHHRGSKIRGKHHEVYKPEPYYTAERLKKVSEDIEKIRKGEV